MNKTKNQITQPTRLILPGKNHNRILAENAQLKSTVERLRFELDKLKRLFHGSKSERFIAADESKLATKAETVTSTTKEVDPSVNKAEKANGHGRPKLPAHLQREEIVLEPAIDLSGAKMIGTVETEILEYIEARIIVKKYIRAKYLLPDGSIVIADLPSLPIPRGNVGPGLLSHLMVSKYVDHLPFYRQRQMLKRLGIDLAESTINDWFRGGCDLAEPVYDCLKKRVLAGDYLMADETPIAVLTEDKPGSTHKGYYWVYYNPITKSVFFDYQKGRGREGPTQLLKDFNGALQADGYAGYVAFDQNPNITLLACMAHA